MMLPVFLSLFFSLLPSSDAIQCIINHEFTVDRYKDISMVKSTCYAAKYCVAVHYEDKNPMKKQGYSVGCDKTDCIDIHTESGWEKHENGHLCKKHRDYGTAGEICCCTKDFCNGIGSAVMIMPVVATLLLWVIA